MTAPLLDVRGLTRVYDGRRVVDDVRFSLTAGEAVALVGESGSGKSTIARLITRLVEPTSGEVWLDGRPFDEGPELAFRARVQMVFQDPFASLNPLQTVQHHLVRPLLRHQRCTRAGAPARAHALLERVGLSPAADFLGAYPQELSGGQRQRVAIARALAVEPRVLVADEPTSMLDASVRAGVLAVLERLKKESQVGLLLITHDLATARALCERALVLYAGQVVEAGPIEALLHAPSHPYTRALLAALPRGTPRVVPEVRVGERVRVEHGCRFAPRCPEAGDDCRASIPSLVPGPDGRQVRCLRRGAPAAEVS